MIEIITKLSENQQNKLLKVFSKIDNGAKLKVLDSQKKTFHKLRVEYDEVDNSMLTLSSLLISINIYVSQTDEIKVNTSKLKARKVKLDVKRQKLLSYWAIVRTLKLEENMSFRNISKYFLKYHKFEVSYSLIYQMWDELEVNKNNKEN